MMKKISSLGLLCLMAVSNISIAYAATAPASPGLSPAVGNESMNYEAKPNSKIEDSFSIQNMGEESGTFEIFIAAPKAGEYDITPWITLSEKNVTMAPGDKKNINFSVAIPENATKEKTYEALISAKAVPLADKKTKAAKGDTTGANIKITSSVSSRLTVKVTDNPTPVEAKSADKDQSPSNSVNGIELNKILLLVVAALIISIGYLLYRRK